LTRGIRLLRKRVFPVKNRPMKKGKEGREKKKSIWGEKRLVISKRPIEHGKGRVLLGTNPPDWEKGRFRGKG